MSTAGRPAAGPVIAAAKGRYGTVHLFSPVAGKVVDISHRPGGSGEFVPVIAISPTAPAQEQEAVEVRELPSSEESRLQLAAAYAGLDLALFRNTDWLVVNGCDPDVGVYGRRCLLRERLADLASGATALASHVGARHAYLAVTRGQLTAAELESLRHDAAPLELLLVPAGYPAGRPEMLVSRLTGKKPNRCHNAGSRRSLLPTTSSPAVYCQDGVTVVGVERVAALGYALHHHRPPAETIVSVDGDAVSRPGVYRVPVGTPLAALLELAGLNLSSLRLLIRGGCLAGQAITLGDAIVGIDDIGFLAFTSAGQRASDAGLCLRCGRCLDACPAGLSPTTIARLAQKSLWGEAASAGAERCLGCGACAYVCPAGRPLVQLIQLAQLQLELVK
ncbi:MAG: 4Fe-4S dicluster domain-containing protein [Limnochordales bacterium]|nr:4Fe-4S dicluster domain-containing protein [Limnochordales bacterium]